MPTHAVVAPPDVSQRGRRCGFARLGSSDPMQHSEFQPDVEPRRSERRLRNSRVRTVSNREHRSGDAHRTVPFTTQRRVCDQEHQRTLGHLGGGDVEPKCGGAPRSHEFSIPRRCCPKRADFRPHAPRSAVQILPAQRLNRGIENASIPRFVIPRYTPRCELRARSTIVDRWQTHERRPCTSYPTRRVSLGIARPWRRFWPLFTSRLSLDRPAN